MLIKSQLFFFEANHFLMFTVVQIKVHIEFICAFLVMGMTIQSTVSINSRWLRTVQTAVTMTIGTCSHTLKIVLPA